MIDHSIEYFSQEGEIYKMQSGSVQKFEETTHPELENLLLNESNLATTLSEMCEYDYPSMLKKLADCRYGGLNFEADFTDGNSTHDHKDCPLRGNCIGENIVCKPIEINGEPLFEDELSILRECSTNKKNFTIASDLDIPFGTLNVSKTKIYDKYGFVTKQQSTIALFEKGLL